jgi:hypothetical protein
MVSAFESSTLCVVTWPDLSNAHAYRESLHELAKYDD